MKLKIRTLQLSLFLIFLGFISCKAQTTKIVGGGCEGCEAIFEYGSKALSSIDTLPKFRQSESRLKISGTVLKNDEKTPASGVILYIYHTNRKGVYETKGNEKGWAKRHGFIRGWVKTDKDGQYTFYTFRPAAYPNGSEPEHIHITVKEPNKNEYYLDDYLFADDPLLTVEQRKKLNNRGGSGIVKPREQGGILIVERNIILGKNIPNYE